MSYSTKRRTSDDIIVKEFWRNNERFADLFNAEFLSGLNYSDRFHPIITIVFYYGEQRWNGPMSLSDMMVDMPDEVKEMFNDYRINLVQIGDTADYDFNNDEVKALFDITNSIYNKDFNAISRNYSEKSLSVELIDMISEMTGTKELARLVNEEKEDKEDDVHMWSAMKEFRDSGVQEGRLEGRREGIIEGQLKGQEEARLDSIKTIMRKLNQTVDEAMDTLDIEEKDRAKYRELINS